MAGHAAVHGFTVERPMVLSFDSEKGLYSYKVRSGRDIQDRRGNTKVQTLDQDDPPPSHM